MKTKNFRRPRINTPAAIEILGTLDFSRSGLAFVTPLEKYNLTNVLVPARFVQTALPGDLVKVELMPARRDHKRKNTTQKLMGRITQVVEPGNRELVTQVQQVGFGSAIVKPLDTRYKFQIQVDIRKLAQTVVVNNFILVRLDKPKDNESWTGQALEFLDQKSELKTLELLVKLNHHVPMEFDSEVLAAAKGLTLDLNQVVQDLPATISQVATATRQDLRSLPFVTIDGADAKDFDDAIYVQKNGDSWVLWVAIADVSYFVKPNTPLDLEARARGNSFYFPSSVEPMLPAELSNELCSLKPHEPRLVLVSQIHFDAQGHYLRSIFFPGVIESAARLTYVQVQAALDKSIPYQVDWLGNAAELATLLMSNRDQQGRLDLDLPEAETILAEDELQELKFRTRLFSHRLIEEFMLSANEAVASYLSRTKYPFPYRVHPAPDVEKLTNLKRTLAAIAINLPKLKANTDLTPLMLNKILHDAQNTPQGYLIGRLVLRSLMQARYSLDSGIHFGLASACYCHFTSPIRRYADLLVHRALKASLTKDSTISRAKIKASIDACNIQERLATESEREMTKRLGCLYLSKHPGEYTGFISGLNSFGLFVELESLPIEGMVRLESLPAAHYDYNPDRLELRSMDNKHVYRLGDKLKVQVQSVNQDRLEIDLLVI